MVSFKLCISDPSTGKTFQKEVKDNMARPFLGLNIGEGMKGDAIELSGYELQITGGSDYCGFPMRKGILGQRKKIVILGGIGFKGDAKGIKKRKTVCGHKIHERISQINLKVTKAGSKKLAEIFGAAEGKEEKKEAKQEAKEHKEVKAESKELKAEEKHKEQKTEVKKEEMKEHKAEKKEEKTLKAEEKKEAKEQSSEKKAAAKESKEEKKE